MNAQITPEATAIKSLRARLNTARDVFPLDVPTVHETVPKHFEESVESYMQINKHMQREHMDSHCSCFR